MTDEPTASDPVPRLTQAMRSHTPVLLTYQGADTALVVCDTNPLAWDWNLVADQIVAQLRGRRNALDRGIFLIEDSGRVRQLL